MRRIHFFTARNDSRATSPLPMNARKPGSLRRSRENKDPGRTTTCLNRIRDFGYPELGYRICPTLYSTVLPAVFDADVERKTAILVANTADSDARSRLVFELDHLPLR